MFETSLAIADAIRSFDLTFISGGLLAATGSLFIDDISVAPAWRRRYWPVTITTTESSTPPIMSYGAKDWEPLTPRTTFTTSRPNFSRTAGGDLTSQAAVPEPSSSFCWV